MTDNIIKFESRDGRSARSERSRRLIKGLENLDRASAAMEDLDKAVATIAAVLGPAQAAVLLEKRAAVLSGKA